MHNGYKHLTVNHSIEFKNVENGAQTYTMEGLWYHAKLSCPSFNRKKDHFLGEENGYDRVYCVINVVFYRLSGKFYAS